jgi:acetylornithine deacetylase/succinyl-diaminopimelate desuccinylase-like protein
VDQRISQHVDAHLPQTIERLKRLVAQRSISAQRDGVRDCAELLAGMLGEAGFTVEIAPTADPDYPAIVAEHPDAPVDAPTLLFYNHYDVQPPDPLDEWETAPFEPVERDGFLYGRGVSDDKGPIAARLAAVEALRAVNRSLPVRVRWLMEGAEEIGSPGFAAFVEANRERLTADGCIWEGGGVNWDGRPLLTLGVKGMLYVELECRSASTDSHSSYAPVVPNPAWRLVWALGSLKDAGERIALRGFYDRVRPMLENEAAAIRALPDTSREFLHNLGVEVAVGEASGFEFRRRLIQEPTANIAGITAGYAGEGAKTILPAVARAKLDFRLVPDQEPDEVLASLRAHLDEHGFSDITVRVHSSEHPARTSVDDPFVALVAESARTAYGTEPYVQPSITGTGPQHPVQHLLGVPVASCGVDYPGNRIHAPNENIRLDYFRLGILHTAQLLADMGAAGPAKKGG